MSTALRAVDTELSRQTAELSGPMLQICRYATQRGRRTRARLLLGATQTSDPRAVQAAAALELLHAATLLQDDIFDRAQLRRGRPAAHRRFGKALAILASDWLLLRSLELAAEVDLHFFRHLAHAGRAMAQAEAQELHPPVLRSVAEATDYGCEIAQGKTARLLAAALCGAAALRGVAPAETAPWEQLGLEMGLTYQYVDDFIDVYGREAAAGKDVGSDLSSGCLTLPVLRAVAALAAQGVSLPLVSIQRHQLGTEHAALLQATLHAAPLQGQVRALLEHRLLAHCRHARDLDIAASAVRAWAADCRRTLDRCPLGDDTGRQRADIEDQRPAAAPAFPHLHA